MASFNDITELDRAKHAATFQQLKPAEGFVPGAQAKALFRKSKLDDETLAQVWCVLVWRHKSQVVHSLTVCRLFGHRTLADIDGDGRMDLGEFVVAMHLITLKVNTSLSFS